MSGDDPERVRNTLEVMVAYCERIAYHMHRFGGAAVLVTFERERKLALG
ncbi:MAG: hypothetical protein IKP04_02255 [Candidatus Methanomethylophilaceae archaeon]|nr:hypothetical protein [Candidatus Methanomethylophilaceae archaeon]